jgi:hypothetical protein
MPSLDLTLVAARRPDLLEATLASFAERVFVHLPPTRVLVNLDPIFGDEADHRATLEVVRARFPDAMIFEPETPGFGAAVKRLWAATTGDYVFHLEDDWVALRDLGEEVLAHFADPCIRQVSFHTADQNRDIARKGHLHRRKDYWRVLGLKVPTFRSFPKFTTSPSILKGDFARAAAALMDPARDPEKQFYSDVNLPLEDLARPFDNYIFSPEAKPVIRDTGREWRDARQIRKTITNATSVWEKADG